jgi:CheY-like chemotaxis protein
MKILLIDDEEDNRLILESILGSRYEVVEAENGVAALARLSDNTGNPIGAILLDGHMPVMDGPTFLAERAKTRFAGIPLAVYSGSGMGLKEIAARFGVPFIVKDGEMGGVESFLVGAALH